MRIVGREFEYLRDRKRRKNSVIIEKERYKQSNALIISLQLSSTVETCARGKWIDAESSMKR